MALGQTFRVKVKGKEWSRSAEVGKVSATELLTESRTDRKIRSAPRRRSAPISNAKVIEQESDWVEPQVIEQEN